MKRYLNIYFTLLKVSFAELAAFRGAFYNSAFGHLAYATFSVIAIYLLTSKTKVVFGWTREELFVLVGVFNVIVGVFRTVFTKNLDHMAEVIFRGQLDQYLLKPVDSQFLLSLRNINIGAFLRFPVALGFTFFVLSTMHVTVGFLDMILFWITVVFSLLLLYSIWFSILTIIIWYTNLSNLDKLLDNITSATRYPKEMFENTHLLAFFILFPVSLISSIPTKILLNKASTAEILELLIVSITFFFFSKLFWRFALRSYTSASG